MEPWWLSSHWSGDRVVNDLQHTTLALTWSDERSIWPIRSIGRFGHAQAHVYFLPNVLSNLLMRNNAKPLILYVLGGDKLIVLRGKDFLTLLDWVIKKTEFGRGLKSCSQSKYTVSAKANGFSSWFIPFSSWTMWWMVENRTREKHYIWLLSQTKHSNVI